MDLLAPPVHTQVFYGVKGEETDQDDCERMIKTIMNKFMQVCHHPS